MFRFKQFQITDEHCGMKIGTDSVLLGAWADVQGAHDVLDLGAGSGLLSLMVVQRNADCQVVAVEIDPEACIDAAENFNRSPWASRLQVENADALAFTPHSKPDLIISNPPYFTSALKSPDASRACARHGAGLLPSTVIEFAAQWLAPGGSLAMITPVDDASDLVFKAEFCHLHLRRQCLVAQKDGRQPTRILWQFSRIDGQCEKQTLAIRNQDGYTPQYIELTKDFYL